jgi:predicted adenylyl cyclase CyaB
MIEVEIRSFISKEKYEELLEFFKKEGEFVNEDDQTTYYFDAPFDLRIQKNNFFSKIWMKKGKIHDEQRKEVEIKFKTDDFERLEKMFLTLGYNVQIKWFRKRHNFKWQDIDVAIDFTKGYGYIIELEKLVEENEKEKALEFLKEKCNLLNISVSSREEFDEKFNYYKENWQKLIVEN